MDNKFNEISKINGDILTLIQITNEIGWETINGHSITRILYLSSVLYSFKYPELENPFYDYFFVSSLRGPDAGNVDLSLKFLLSNRYIEEESKNNGIYKLGKNPIPHLSELPNINAKEEWMKIIIYIMGIYGEEKIYDFIFRDPEFQDNMKRNTTNNELEIGPENKTIEILNKFKKAFEKTLKNKSINLDDKQYLNLYFDYIFSKILKGET